MEIIILDTDFVIEFFNGNTGAIKLIESFKNNTFAITVITKAELI